MRTPISIIILNHNNYYIKTVVERCILQLQNKDEIIIINDHTNNLAEVKILEQEYTQISSYIVSKKSNNRGYNRNIGLKKAKNDIILMIDGDILIDDNALNIIEEDFIDPEIVAVSGLTHLLGYTKEQLEILGINKINNIEKIEFCDLKKYPELLDYRGNYNDGRLNSDKNWFYFFTCFLAIKKAVVEKNVMFLETLSGWGAEDIEYAYKLSLEGKLFFENRINNIHIPHNRDHVLNLCNNYRNLYLVLKEHPILDFEILIKMDSPYKSMKKILDFIKKMDYNSFFSFDKKCDNCLYTTVYDAKNCNISTGNNNLKFALLGIALPLSTNSIENAYIDGKIFGYPLSIVCMILNEHIRVAKNVYIVGEIRLNRTLDDSYFKSHIAKHINIWIPIDLKMFKFCKNSIGYKVCSSLHKYDLKID